MFCQPVVHRTLAKIRAAIPSFLSRHNDGIGEHILVVFDVLGLLENTAAVRGHCSAVESVSTDDASLEIDIERAVLRDV